LAEVRATDHPSPGDYQNDRHVDAIADRSMFIAYLVGNDFRARLPEDIAHKSMSHVAALASFL
jgi:hypothetical protein